MRIRRHKRRQCQQAGFVELTRHMRGAAPVFCASSTVLRQTFVQVMPQVLTVQHKHRTAHVEQFALNRIGQGAFACARQAAEQHRGRLLAKTLRTFLSGHMRQLAMMAGAAMTHRLGNDHTCAHGAIGQAVNDDERTRGAVAFITVQRNRCIEADLDLADLVQLQGAGRTFLQRVHVDFVDDAGNGTRYIAGRALDVVLLARQHRLFGHPYQHGFEAVSHRRNAVGMHQQVATGDVDLVLHGQRDCLPRACVLQLAFKGNNGFDTAALARRQHHHLVALAHDATGQGAGEATEVQVRTVHVLHRKAQVSEVTVRCDFHGFKNFHQRLPGVPGRALAFVHDVVAFKG